MSLKKVQSIQQKGIPIQIQLSVQEAKNLNCVIENSYLEKAIKITDDCFVSFAVSTVKK